MQKHKLELPDLEKSINALETDIAALNRIESDAIIIYALSQEVMKSVYALHHGEHYILETGRTSSDGITHPVIMEFSKNKDGTYDLLMYLTGKEEGQYRTVLYADQKDWLRPVVRYANIPVIELFFNDQPALIQSDFFQAAIETRIFADNDFTAEYVTLKLVGHLQRYRVTDTNTDASGFISAARSHTDAWRAVKAVIYRRLDKQTYKKLLLDLKIRVLIEGYQNFKKQLPQDIYFQAEHMRIILQACAKNVLKSIAMAEARGWVTEEQLRVGRATALDLIKTLKIVKKQLKQTVSSQTTLFEPLIFEVNQDQLRISALTENQITSVQSKKIATSPVSSSIVPFKLPPAQELTKTLDAYVARYDHKIVGNKIQATEIELLVAQFPIPTNDGNYWNSIDPEEFHQLANVLEKIVLTYSNSMRGSAEGIAPSEANTAFALYVIIHYVAVRLDQKSGLSSRDPASIRNYPIYFPGVACDDDEYLLFSNSDDFTRRQEILNYFKSTYTNNPNLGNEYTYGQYSHVLQSKKRGVVPFPLFHFASINYQSLSKFEIRGLFTFLSSIAKHYPKLQIQSKEEIEQIIDLLIALPPKADKKQPNVFREAGLEYIQSLTLAAFVAHQFSSHPQLLAEASANAAFTISIKKKEQAYAITYLLGKTTLTTNQQPNSLSLHSELSADYKKLFENKNKWNARLKSSNTSCEEVDLLKANITYKTKTPADTLSILRQSCEPNLYPYKLISFYQDQIELLAIANEQTFFEIEFFRSVAQTPLPSSNDELASTLDAIWKPYLRKNFLPLYLELQQKSFQEACRAFLQKGIDRYYLRQPNQHPDVFAVLFFIRINQRISRFMDGNMLIETVPMLEKLLSIKELTCEERSAVYLHLIDAYRSQKAELTQHEIEQLFIAWVYFKNTPLKPQWHNPLLQKEAQKFIYNKGVLLQVASEEFRRNIIALALRQMDLGSLPSHFQLSHSPSHIIRVILNDSEFWELNLTEGVLTNQTGVLAKIKTPAWVKNELFIYLFGENSMNFLQTGEIVYFSHPNFGSYRVIGDNLQSGLQKNINGLWYQYVSPKQLAKKAIPSSLLANHTHWMPVDKTQKLLLICKKENGEIAAQVTSEGHITSEDGLIHTIAAHKILARFEKQQYILFIENAKKASQILFSRYVSQSGDTLSFEHIDGQFIYSLNKKYILSSNQPQGVLGDIEQYLFLNHTQESKYKALVPLRQLGVYRSLSSKHKIDVSDAKVTWAEGREFFTNQQGCYTFLEYDFKGKQLIPLTQEATFYLSYLFLTRRSYKKAIHLINQIDFKDSISSSSIDIVKWIIAHAEDERDASPEAIAVALHAWTLGQKAQMRAKIEQGNNKEPRFSFNITLKHLPERYLRIEHTLAQEVRLSKDQIELIKNSKNNLSLIHYTDFENFIPASRKNTPKMSESSLPNPHQYTSHYENRTYVENASYFLYSSLEKPYSIYFERFLLTATPTRSFEKSFFEQAYSIAKKGTEGQKKQLSFRLQLIGERYQTYAPPDAWRYLQYVLNHPRSETPSLPSENSIEARWKFVKDLKNAVNSSARRESPKQSSIPCTYSTYKLEAPEKPIAAAIVPPKRLEVVEEPLKLAIPTKEDINDRFTNKLFAAHFNPIPNKDQPFTHVAAIEKLLISTDEENIFTNALNAEFRDFKRDFQAGQEINAKRTYYQASDIVGLQTSLNSRIVDLNAEKANLEAAILEIANKNDPTAIKKALYLESGIQSELNLKQLTGLFLQGDRQKFAQANPYLKDPAFVAALANAYHLDPTNSNVVIDYLYDLIGLYMGVCVHYNNLARAEKLCQDIRAIKEDSSIKREALIQKLAAELKPNPDVYSPNEYPAFLVFEYLSGMQIRESQAKLLKQLLEIDPQSKTYVNRVIQLIMGDGKTSVVGVIALKMAARKELLIAATEHKMAVHKSHLSIFVVPASQYTSVGYNLKKSFREYFSQDIEEIDVRREQLTPNMCKEIEHRLKTTIDKGDCLLVKAETLQCIELEFLDLVYKACEASTISIDILEQINALRRILLIFRTQGDALMDEVDLLLNILQEINFPMGNAKHIAPERIALVRELFSLFINENVQISKDRYVNLREKIGLIKNHQTLLSKDDLYGEVAQAIAWNLDSHFDALLLKNRPDFHPSFYRYISGKMNFICQKMLDLPLDPDYPKWEKSLSETDQIDFAFLKYVRQMSEKTSSKDEIEAAHQIALVKHLTLDVFPVSFEKESRRNIGRDESKTGPVKPFLAVDVRSDNFFGYHLEELVYHFVVVLQCGIEEPQMEKIAESYRKQAEYYSDLQKRPFDETLEAEEFKLLTQVALCEINLPGKLTEAVKNLKENFDAVLKLEAETAANCVTYYSHRLTSTGCALVRMFESIRAMSGTPWNVQCYDKTLAKNFEPSWGTEGQIADILLSRASKADHKRAHIIRSSDLGEILKELFDKHPHKQRIRMIMDSGALFQKYSNLEVAQALRDYLNMPVLFFIRNPKKNEKTPDTLACLKPGSDIPQIIGSTRLDEIEKIGLKLEDYFVFIDEHHKEGTDVPVIPEAIGFMTVDKIRKRDFFQTIIRLREFFTYQDIEYVVADHLAPSLVQPNIENKDLAFVIGTLLNAIVNQTIKNAQNFFRFCKQNIDNVFRQKLLVDNLLPEELTHSTLKEKFLPFQHVIAASQEDSPYQQFGALEYEKNTVDALIAYKARKMQSFEQGKPSKELYDAASASIDEIIAEAQKSPYLQKTVLEGGGASLGLQVDIFAEVSTQTAVQTNVNTDVNQELKFYQTIKADQSRPEDQWETKQISDFLSSMLRSSSKYLHQTSKKDLNSKDGFTIFSLPSLFQKEHFNYNQDYTGVFHPYFLASYSWAYTCKSTLPIFHNMQRSAENLMIMGTNEGYKAIVISQNEARQFKDYLHAQYSKQPLLKDVWLVQANGVLLEDNPHNALPKFESVDELLLQANVFNGRIDYLNCHLELTSKWLYMSKDSQRKIDFLKLRVAQNEKQKKLFSESEILGQRLHKPQSKLNSRIVSERISAMGKNQIQALQESDRGVIALLSQTQLNFMLPTQLELILPHQVGLITDENLIKHIPKKYASNMVSGQMAHISESQLEWFNSITFIQAMPSSLFKSMSASQFANLSPYQIGQIDNQTDFNCLTDSQLAHANEKQVSNRLISDQHVPHLRKKTAIQALNSDQLLLVTKRLREQYLTSTQVKQLHPVKHLALIQELTQQQASWVDNPEVINCLPEEYRPKPKLQKEIQPQDIVKQSELPPLDTKPIIIPEAIYPSTKTVSPTVPTHTDEPILGQKPTLPALPTMTQSQPTQPQHTRRKQIAKIAAVIIAGLIGLSLAFIGTSAIMGAHAAFAPQFAIILSHGIGASSYFLASVGGITLIGLASYAIYVCQNRLKQKYRRHKV